VTGASAIVARMAPTFASLNVVQDLAGADRRLAVALVVAVTVAAVLIAAVRSLVEQRRVRSRGECPSC